MSSSVIHTIHQFHSGSAVGDAVTNGMFFIRELLHELGFKSEIYVQHVAPGLEDALRSYQTYESGPGQVLIVHHSMGHDLDGWIREISDRKILVYHNITPEHFFSCPTIRHYIRRGHAQLREMQPLFESVIADSDFNRAELVACGYDRVETIPLLFDADRLATQPFDLEIARKRGDCFRVLCTGRLVQNKCQHEVVSMFAELVALRSAPAELVIVGRSDFPEYQNLVEETIRRHGLQDRVRMTGRVTNEQLLGWYRASDALISLSEHEGFGVPLIEAMVFDVPVFGAAYSAVPETMGGAGILFPDKKDLRAIAGALWHVHEDRALKRSILKGQQERAAAFTRPRLRGQLSAHLAHLGIRSPTTIEIPPPRAERIQLEGPAETTYSLAVVNRSLALAIDTLTGGNSSVFLTEGPGNYRINTEALARLPLLQALCARGSELSRPDVLIRNLYPPRVRDADGRFNALYFFWEESSVPADWVREFNRRLDCIFVATEFVKRALVNSGVVVPVICCGIGVDQRFEQEAAATALIPSSDTFRFLHVSSCFPRKGADVMLQVFARTFEPEQGVRLVIKTFSNPHHQISRDIEGLRTPRGQRPLITLIEGDLAEPELQGLYSACDCLVAPSRGEGFALPIAEMFLHGKPAITTGYSAPVDYCTPENSWLLDFRLRPSGSHIAEHGSLWAEPDAAHLATLMQEVVATSPEERSRRGLHGRKSILPRYTWENTARLLLHGVNRVREMPTRLASETRVAWISPWSSRCGIATYSSFILAEPAMQALSLRVFANHAEALPDESGVDLVRCWNENFNAEEQPDLTRRVSEFGPHAVVFQFNFGFFSVRALARMLRDFHEQGIATIIDFHSTADVDKPDLRTSLSIIRDELAECHRLLVHNTADLDRLQDFGLLRNAAYFPHGVMERPEPNKAALRNQFGLGDGPILGSYGFLLPQKGILELLRAFIHVQREFPSAKLLLVNARHPDPSSAAIAEEIQSFIKVHHLEGSVIAVHEFLQDEEALLLLECADVTVFAYQNTQESASGAVRFALASHSVVTCTPSPIFADLEGVAYKLSSYAGDEFAADLIALLRDESKRSAILAIQQEWVRDNSWRRSAERLRGMIMEAVNDSLIAVQPDRDAFDESAPAGAVEVTIGR